ncbi:lysozyme inhibitor LprI family protein [Coralliovum pocilloporae]|uniref:lysozyme inhibitor LprI family protein n=1 Tax=Coralliovum pocilloporae TaxID=3066369 RepID=UPI003306A8A9
MTVRYICCSLVGLIAVSGFWMAVLPGDGANANPSFSCDGRLTRTEAAICDHQRLGALDRRMVGIYRLREARTEGRRKRQLQTDQKIWRRWRDTCGRAVGCLQRRYEQRIIDLAGIRNPDPGSARSAEEPVSRRLVKGRLQMAYPDGRIEWESADGSTSGSSSSDGQQTVVQKAQVVDAGFPQLPDAYADWGDGLEDELLGVIDTLLPPQDHQPYRDLHQNRIYSDRVLNHIRAIRFLVSP